MRKLKQRTDQALQEATDLGELAALLDAWQPEAPNTDLWPLLAARLSKAEAHFKGETQQVPLVITPELREQVQKNGEVIQRVVARLEPFGTEVNPWIAAVERLTAQTATARYGGKEEEMQTSASEEKVAEPIAKMVRTIFEQAHQLGASLVYFFPKEKSMQVWFRINGQIRDMLPLPKIMQNEVVACLKTLAGLSLTENSRAQEGAYTLELGEVSASLVIIATPLLYGEKVVVRFPEHSPKSMELMEPAPLNRKSEREFWKAEAFAENFWVVDITKWKPEADAVLLVPADVARRHRLIPVRRDAQTLYVAMADPRSVAGIDDVKIASRVPVVRALSAYPPDIDAAIEACYSVTAPGGDRDRLPPQPPTAVGTSSEGEFDPLKRIQELHERNLGIAGKRAGEEQSKGLSELAGTLSEVVGELAALRREVTRLREEVAALRRERSGGGYPTLMPYARADDKPLPLG